MANGSVKLHAYLFSQQKCWERLLTSNWCHCWSARSVGCWAQTGSCWTLVLTPVELVDTDILCWRHLWSSQPVDPNVGEHRPPRSPKWPLLASWWKCGVPYCGTGKSLLRWKEMLLGATYPTLANACCRAAPKFSLPRCWDFGCSPTPLLSPSAKERFCWRPWQSCCISGVAMDLLVRSVAFSPNLLQCWVQFGCWRQSGCWNQLGHDSGHLVVLIPKIKSRTKMASTAQIQTVVNKMLMIRKRRQIRSCHKKGSCCLRHPC